MTYEYIQNKNRLSGFSKGADMNHIKDRKGNVRTEWYSNNKNRNSIKSSWIQEEWIPPKDHHKRFWRYRIMDIGYPEVLAEYKTYEEATKFQKLIYPGHRIQVYEPTLEMLMKEDRIRRSNKRFQAGYGA